MRLCAVAHINPFERTQHTLLPVSGSDAWRHLGGPVCDSRPVRQDLLDHVVWNEIVRSLEDPSLIQCELDRRLSAARTSDPTKQWEKALEREVRRTRKAIDRLLTAYQEELLSLDELRRRMPELRQREHALKTELNSILDQISDRAVFRRIAETLSGFLSRSARRLIPSTSRTATDRSPRRQRHPGRRRDDRHPTLHSPILHDAER